LNLKLFSTSTLHGGKYLDYCQDEVSQLFHRKKEVLFIPYARPAGITHEAYTDIAKRKFKSLGLELSGIHQHNNPVAAISSAEGVFVGGGNTFVLLNALYEHELLLPIQEAVRSGMPYMGTSAGTNVAGLTIGTTNDMPVVYPPSFNALGLISCNINPHYLDPDPNSTHNGETRETRIKEFHFQQNQPVIGLREGSWIAVDGNEHRLEGKLQARVFQRTKEPVEVSAGSDLNFLLC
jgi:dipeptidase E